jgi:hypothetical protein
MHFTLAASTRPCGGDGVLIKKQSSRISIFNLYLEGKESRRRCDAAPSAQAEEIKA